jgi:hypothetical protein
MPVDDCLIRHAVLVIQNLQRAAIVYESFHVTRIYELATNLQDLRERLHDPRVLVAVGLHGVDEGDLCLGAWTEWLDDRREALRSIQTVNG